jgi:hypothetical protein
MFANIGQLPARDLTISKKYAYGWMIGVGSIFALYWLATRKGK